MVSGKSSAIGRSFPQTNYFIGRNPKAFESVQVPAKRIVRFKMGSLCTRSRMENHS
jgi:nucleoid DNA-binding protein